ncbi:MAG: type I DNA topoisomerase [Syntrophaceae bacterium]|nr:type I DNA topoisomerase [Syntrophaceae bacterium]
MPNALIIVESPTKVKTIKKYLGSEYDVRASVGHVKDLPKNKLGIDIEHDFSPTYQVLEAKKKVIAELKKAAKAADSIYLAPDPDREGEAIAWHIAEEIGTKGKPVYRVLFNDLTKNTMLAAIRNPLPLDVNRYEAQQTRRILDRLVGYQISPILWKKISRGLSAGRVQSVAVRIVCEREEEIRNFKPEEYWTITASLEGANPPPFEAKLVKIAGKKAKVSDEAQARDLVGRLKEADFTVSSIERKETRRNPLPPFTTSKLQQEASRWLRFSPKKTMMVAQKLYEGIELGKEGPVGLITYMRTDSVRVAGEAVAEARAFIQDVYGKDFLPAKAKVYATSERAQDAHEAIRPTSLAYRPAEIKPYLSSDEFRLYQLIWNRFVASQMNPAVYDQTIVDITAGDCLFQARGSVLKFAGFTILYTEGKDTDDENGNGKLLPNLTEKEILKLLELKPEQHFTQPPPRFTEAMLVRELEEKGIGRPSTYATILSTIQERNYVKLEQGRIHPTELGMHVNEFLVKRFPKILDVEFTAGMEDHLDQIEKGTLNRIDTLKEFYGLLKKYLDEVPLKQEPKPTEDTCEKCGSPMVIKWGRNGRFLACSKYPDCKSTKNLNGNGANGQAEAKPTDVACEKCGKPMVLKEGRFGKFLGCSGYPECKNTMPFSTGVPCPEEGCTGTLAEKRTKKGKSFYGCTRYPQCQYATWDRPIAEACPECGAAFLVEKYNRKTGRMKACVKEGCGFKEPLA